MKKSLLLLMFALATIGFEVCAMEGGDTLAAVQRPRSPIFGDDCYDVDSSSSPAQRPLASGGRFYSESQQSQTCGAHYVRGGEASVGHIKDLLGQIEGPYTTRVIKNVYGEVSTIIIFPSSLREEGFLVNEEGEFLVNEEGEAGNDGNSSIVYGLVTSRPVLVLTVSAATAGVVHEIVKRWNKKYNAKKAAALVGAASGVITGAYLYWPTSSTKAKGDSDRNQHVSESNDGNAASAAEVIRVEGPARRSVTGAGVNDEAPQRVDLETDADLDADADADLDADVQAVAGAKVSFASQVSGFIKGGSVLTITASVAAASVTYAITKFINDKWNKNYDAKRNAAIVGVGVGIITGACLYFDDASDSAGKTTV